MVFCAVLVAMEVVLSRFLSFNVWNQKIGISFVAVAMAGILFGPVGGAVVGGLADFIGAILFPIGTYFPGFTLTAALTGMCFGFFLKSKKDFRRDNKKIMIRTVLCAVINQLAGSLLLNTLWISVLYGTPFRELLVTRLVQCAIMIPLEIIIIPFLIKLSLKINIKTN